MSWETAEALWGAASVAAPLAEPDPEPMTAALAAEVRRRAPDLERFATWTRTLPWARFCAVVRVVAEGEDVA